MSDPAIRRATDGDARRLAAVYRRAYSENRDLGYPASASSVTADEVATWIDEARVFVAAVDGPLVGGVRLQFTSPDRAKVSRLGVHPDHKGEGIGTRLLTHAESVAREADRETVWLTTPPEHPYLPDFYRDRGYERTEPYPLPDRDYDEVVMEKSLL